MMSYVCDAARDGLTIAFVSFDRVTISSLPFLEMGV